MSTNCLHLRSFESLVFDGGLSILSKFDSSATEGGYVHRCELDSLPCLRSSQDRRNLALMLGIDRSQCRAPNASTIANLFRMTDVSCGLDWSDAASQHICLAVRTGNTVEMRTA